jgi:hypothetical protein
MEDGVPSVAMLVAKYAGDVTPGAVVAELARLGLVELLPKGFVKPLSPYFMPPQVNGQLFAAGAFSLRNLLSTIAYNTNPRHSGAPLFERYVWSDRLPDASKATAHRIVLEKGGLLLAFFDDWFREHEVVESTANPDLHEVGVGIYYFDSSKR